MRRMAREDPAVVASARFGADWPHLDRSRFVWVDKVRWHVQLFGVEGPLVVLAHGTGASTHSWRDVAPLLAAECQVAVMDLPGHGLTEAPPSERPSLANTARLLGALAAHLPARPVLAVGHSAGAAALIRSVLDGHMAPKAVMSLNGALTPFPGMAGEFFPRMAKILFLNPFAPRFFAWRARDRGAVERLLEGTGSRLSPAGVDFYVRLFRDHRHLDGVLDMMANWDLASLQADLPRFETPLHLIAGALDRATPPKDAETVARRLPVARVTVLPHVGHLAHEEQPKAVADLIRAVLREHRLLGEAGATTGP